MLVVASGSLLPSVEDWFGARRELRTIAPLLAELSRRHPNIGIGERPRGPLLFRVAEQMSLISDALYLEATAVLDGGQVAGSERVEVTPDTQARRVASWIYDGRSDRPKGGSRTKFPGPAWLRQPATYSDREWILAIAAQYRELDRQGKADAAGTTAKASVSRVNAIRPAD